jgi:uncharacterized protein YlbG (UPF0298 family)
MLKRIEEAQALPVSFRGKYFFYGIEKTEDALSIFVKKELPIFLSKKGYFERTYLTGDLSVACEYANCSFGTIFPKSFLKKNRYGYIFYISTEELSDIYPNESEVGRFIQKIYDYQYTKGLKDQEYYSFLRWVWEIIDRKEQVSLIHDEGDSYYSIGKKVLDSMSGDRVLWFLNKVSNRVSNKGRVNYSFVYRIDRSLLKDVEEDGSNLSQAVSKVDRKEDIL